jgi:transposase-like protein
MAANKMDLLGFLGKQLEKSEGDPMRAMVQQFAQQLMGAEADALCGAGYGERSDGRVNVRNGYRERLWSTRVGDIDLAIPKLRHGTYFPHFLLEPRRRSEKALMAAVVEAYVLGVSTRKVEELVQTLGVERLSKSQVSELAKSLDETVQAFRNRPLDTAPYAYVWLDAMYVKCRENGRVQSVATLVAVGVNANGQREVLGIDVATSEDGAGWLAFLRGLVARGLSGVGLAISDAHPGLRDALTAALPGASWQRCRTHFMRNLLTRVPKNAQALVATIVRTVFAQPDSASTRDQHRRVVDQLRQLGFGKAADLLADTAEELLAFTAFSKEHWKQIWSNNPQERLNKELRRRTDVVGIFPNRDSVIRLVGAVLCEQHDDWAVTRRYMTIDQGKGTIDVSATPPLKKSA